MTSAEYHDMLELQDHTRSIFEQMNNLRNHPIQMIERRVPHHRHNRKILALRTLGNLVDQSLDDLLDFQRIRPNVVIDWVYAIWRYANEHEDGVPTTLIEPAMQRILEVFGVDCQDAFDGLEPGSWTSPLHHSPEGRLPLRTLPQDTPDMIFTASERCAWLDEIMTDDGWSISGRWKADMHFMQIRIPLSDEFNKNDARSVLQEMIRDNGRLICPIMGRSVHIGDVRHINATSANLIVDLESEVPLPIRRNPNGALPIADASQVDVKAGLEILSSVYEPRTTMWSQALISLSEHDTTSGRSIWASFDRDPSVPKGLNDVPSARFDRHTRKWWIDLAKASPEALRMIASTYPAATIVGRDGATAHVRANSEGWDPHAFIKISETLQILLAQHGVPIQEVYLLACEKYANDHAVGETTKWPKCGGTRQDPFLLPESFPEFSFRRIDDRIVIEDLPIDESGIRVRETTGRLVFMIPPGLEHGPLDIDTPIGEALGIEWLPVMPITSVQPASKGRTVVEAYSFAKALPVPYEPEQPRFRRYSTELTPYRRSIICRSAIDCADHALANDASVASQMRDALHEIEDLCGDDLARELVRICLHNVTAHAKYDALRRMPSPDAPSREKIDTALEICFETSKPVAL